MLAASNEPSAEPAPTSVCSSSMKMMAFCDSISSFMMVFRRSSNWPRYVVPATINGKSTARMRLICQERRDFAIGDALRQSFDDGSLLYARLADRYWVVLC